MLYKEKQFEALKVDVIIQDANDALLKNCPNATFATASESKLAILPTLGQVNVSEEK